MGYDGMAPVLVLNADFRPLSYFPLSLWSWQEAIKAVVLDRVQVLSEYETEIHSPSVSLKLPSVIALREYVPTNHRVAFTRFNVFLRDRFSCQYCGQRFAAQDLTFDHVMPRARGGMTWSPLVRLAIWPRQIICRHAPAAGRSGNRSGRLPMNYRILDVRSRQITCIRVGGIFCIGTVSWKIRTNTELELSLVHPSRRPLPLFFLSFDAGAIHGVSLNFHA